MSAPYSLCYSLSYLCGFFDEELDLIINHKHLDKTATNCYNTTKFLKYKNVPKI